MKLAETWAHDVALEEGWGNDQEWAEVIFIRKVQADALRYAANLSGEQRDTFLLALADQLDPSLPKLEPDHKGCRHDTI